ncbi:hypothetical protein VPHK469_0238 [Vibrio phage K469]
MSNNDRDAGVGTSKSMAWAIPLVAVLLSIGTSIATSSFNSGTDTARLDSFEKQIMELKSDVASADKTYSVITNQMTNFGGKLDLIVNDISYIKRDYSDMKDRSGMLTNDISELKLYVLTQGEQGDLNGR